MHILLASAACKCSRVRCITPLTSGGLSMLLFFRPFRVYVVELSPGNGGPATDEFISLVLPIAGGSGLV